MRRMALALTGALLSSTFLVGCGGSSAYCDTVEASQKTLDSFGQNRTDKAFTGYATTLEKIAADAPADIKADWTKLADVTRAVLTAHKAVGLSLEDMADTKKVDAIDPADLPKLNDAYQKFNNTTKQREEIVKNVKTECDITLT
ncbi:hypothetical protein BH09ACT10_BH09ACT10_09690 [soil metagenome]